ncbi:sporulation-specific protein 22 [Coniothyrium glycines]
MGPPPMSAKTEREKKLKSILAFATSLSKRLEDARDTALYTDLQVQIRGLPLPCSSIVATKQAELDKLGTELWNTSTRLRREDAKPSGQKKGDAARKNGMLCLLRAFAFLILDSAGGSGSKHRHGKSCIRLMKVALKAAKVCIEGNELGTATKVLERGAEYQDSLSKVDHSTSAHERELGDSLRVEYFAVRTTLAWREDRLDMAEHMFAKCKQLNHVGQAQLLESLADLCYEIGKDRFAKRDYDLAIRWLERAYDFLGDQESELSSPEAGELRLSTMHNIVQAHMKLRTPESKDKAWQMVKLLETDFGDKMIVLLLKIELLSEAETMDTPEFYNVLLRMIRTVVLNDANFKTIMHHIHRIKEHSIGTACRILEDLIEIRLFREENEKWIEKALVTRIWLGSIAGMNENTLEQLQELFESVGQQSISLTAPATHAAQTLLWKRVEAAFSLEQYDAAEAWCRVCLHPIFDKAGAQDKAKVSRKIIQCAIARQDYSVAQEAYQKMPDSGKEEPVTGYLMYKACLQSGNTDLAGKCLDMVCRNSAKDATLLYACVMEAQNAGNKRQAIGALQKVLEKYDHGAPTGIHLPALLRCTARLLQNEMVKDGRIDPELLNQLCVTFEGACAQAKASRRRPATPAQQLFTVQEFEWFSKNAYNLSLKYCAEMSPMSLVRLINSCIEFIKILRDVDTTSAEGDLCLRLVFCEFLAACAYTTIARAEDNIEQCLQQYLEVRKHSQEFRRAAAEGIDKLGGSAQADIISKYFQIVKLELEAVLKLEKWDELDDLFDQCWKYKSPDHYETLADLVLVIHSCIVNASLDVKYQRKLLSVLQKIIGLTCRQSDSDITKLARWIRCLFQLSLPVDEGICLKCIEQVTHIAAKRHGDVERYPKTDLEWLAISTFNQAVDFFLREDDESDAKTKLWAEKSFVIAQWIEDDGKIRDLLMERYSGMHFNKG